MSPSPLTVALTRVPAPSTPSSLLLQLLWRKDRAQRPFGSTILHRSFAVPWVYQRQLYSCFEIARLKSNHFQNSWERFTYGGVPTSWALYMSLSVLWKVIFLMQSIISWYHCQPEWTHPTIVLGNDELRPVPPRMGTDTVPECLIHPFRCSSNCQENQNHWLLLTHVLVQSEHQVYFVVLQGEQPQLTWHTWLPLVSWPSFPPPLSFYASVSL